jgi:hypothetical protein
VLLGSFSYIHASFYRTPLPLTYQTCWFYALDLISPTFAVCGSLILLALTCRPVSFFTCMFGFLDWIFFFLRTSDGNGWDLVAGGSFQRGFSLLLSFWGALYSRATLSSVLTLRGSWAKWDCKSQPKTTWYWLWVQTLQGPSFPLPQWHPLLGMSHLHADHRRGPLLLQVLSSRSSESTNGLKLNAGSGTPDSCSDWIFGVGIPFFLPFHWCI